MNTILQQLGTYDKVLVRKKKNKILTPLETNFVIFFPSLSWNSVSVAFFSKLFHTFHFTYWVSSSSSFLLLITESWIQSKTTLEILMKIVSFRVKIKCFQFGSPKYYTLFFRCVKHITPHPHFPYHNTQKLLKV